MDEQLKKVTVLLTPEQFERFQAYCESHGHKKSTLTCRLIREHLDFERFHPQGELVFPADSFTTCLVLRADRHGKLTVANAGHIPPYRAGNELVLESGLPLGLSAEATYGESTFQFRPNQQLTLLTDGVVEARDKSGAHYGFERESAISTQTPEAIACAAQTFGQDDDITVLSLSYAGVPASV